MVCIDDSGVYLTIGQTYEILSEHNGWVSVINDMGKYRSYPKYHFE